MKVRMMNMITLVLLFCLLLTAVACSTPSNSEKNTEKTPTAGGSTNTDSADTTPVTNIPVYPGDIEIELPELQETPKIILSMKNGKVLGASSLVKPTDSDIIDNYSDFRALYGTVEGIDEAFFDTYILRLVHAAQSSGSTRYAVESVTQEDGTLKVEIIEQHAAISTRDLRYWYVFAAVEKAQAETPVAVNVTGIQLAE